MIKNLTAVFISYMFLFACINTTQEKKKGLDEILIPQKFEKYKSYIDDARFKIYLKMGMQKVPIKDTILYRDSMLLGEMNLTPVRCQEFIIPEYTGLLVEFTFRYNGNDVFYNNSPFFSSSIFYRNKNIHDWFFAYGELSLISYDYPREIDTLSILEYLDKGGKLNIWFTKMIRDSIVNRR